MQLLKVGKVDHKNTDLFHFLSEHIALVTRLGGEILVTAYDTQVFCTNNDQDTSELEPCRYETADSRFTVGTGVKLQGL